MSHFVVADKRTRFGVQFKVGGTFGGWKNERNFQHFQANSDNLTLRCITFVENKNCTIVESRRTAWAAPVELAKRRFFRNSLRFESSRVIKALQLSSKLERSLRTISKIICDKSWSFMGELKLLNNFIYWRWLLNILWLCLFFHNYAKRSNFLFPFHAARGLREFFSSFSFESVNNARRTRIVWVEEWARRGNEQRVSDRIPNWSETIRVGMEKVALVVLIVLLLAEFRNLL